MISMQIFNSGVMALVSLVIAAIAITGLMMVAPRLSRAGETPRGGTRPDLSPEPLPNPDDDSFVIPDDASELTGDRELALV
ncbi:MAG TPA: hypothetical protein VFW50_23635 [Streptosporangiaceae bacterium]|nr:hypothetical protein [Streptosporangiaceae bacterium]